MIHQIGDTIGFRVRIDGDPTTDNPTAIVYDPTDTPVGSPLTIGAGLTQVGSTRVVVGSFVPTSTGDYSVKVTDDLGLDVVKQFEVRDASLQSVGSGITSLHVKIDAQDLILADIQTKIDSIGGGGHFG